MHRTGGRRTLARRTPGSSEDRAVLRFHQERLASAEERDERRTYWKGVLDRVVAELA